MNTAIDTSVLLTIFNREPGWETWSECLRRSLSEGQLLACPVVFAEISRGFNTPDQCVEALQTLEIEYSHFTVKSAWLAGRMFSRYRREGGKRDHLIPDFMIAAHAVEQAHRFAAIDRGYMSRFFSRLSILAPN